MLLISYIKICNIFCGFAGLAGFCAKAVLKMRPAQSSLCLWLPFLSGLSPQMQRGAPACSSLCLAEDNVPLLRKVTPPVSGLHPAASLCCPIFIAARILLAVKMGMGLSHPLRGFESPHYLLRRKHEKEARRASFLCFGGGHGTRTHEAVTPYSLSRRAP